MKENSIPKVGLEEVNKIEITTIIDNYTDMLIASSESKTELVTRAPLRWEGATPAETPLAEHGLCLLIKLLKNGREHNILCDGGATKVGIRHNLRALRIDLTVVEAIVLSHGHKDHYGGLAEAGSHIGKKGVPLIAHPDAFLTRYREYPDGTVVKHGRLTEQSLERVDVELFKSTAPCLLASNLLTTTGEVERFTDFETIDPHRYIERSGKMMLDTVLDDQSLVLNLKGKGLVVITGCAHSGVINTLRYAQKITQKDRIYAVLGGFHLTGRGFETKTNRTLMELRNIDPAVVAPMHCTSWRAMQRIYQMMPHSFVLNSVGTKFLL
ncbi:MBL fold metallo-hydrolase [Chloroflexota bacterium]